MQSVRYLMRSVRYLKVVLTVIAACLVWICLRDVVIVETANASDGAMDVNIVGIGGGYIGYSSNLPVEVKNWP